MLLNYFCDIKKYKQIILLSIIYYILYIKSKAIDTYNLSRNGRGLVDISCSIDQTIH